MKIDKAVEQSLEFEGQGAFWLIRRKSWPNGCYWREGDNVIITTVDLTANDWERY